MRFANCFKAGGSSIPAMFSELFEVFDELLVFGGIFLIFLVNNGGDGLVLLVCGLVLMISRDKLGIPPVSRKQT